jgi:hypothetical protein
MKLSMLVGAAALSAAALAALPAAAQTQTSFYGNVGYTAIDADDVTLGALTGRVGAQFHPNFAVEAEAGFGVKDDSANVGGVNVKGELKHSVALYGVGILPINDKFDLLARVGYGSSKLEASALGTKVEGSQESWNYGVGAQYSFDGANGVRVDYTRYDFDGDFDKADTWAVSYVRKF